MVGARTVDANDGTGGHTWTYSYAFRPNGTVVTSPEGNDTAHSFSPPVSAAGCSNFETQTQHYQGSQSSGALLATKQTQYIGDQSLLSPSLANNVVPTQATVTFTLPSGQTSRAVNTYDPTFTNANAQPFTIGTLLQKDEYDFSNSLVRTTKNHYLWQDSATHLSNNLL